MGLSAPSALATPSVASSFASINNALYCPRQSCRGAALFPQHRIPPHGSTPGRGVAAIGLKVPADSESSYSRKLPVTSGFHNRSRRNKTTSVRRMAFYKPEGVFPDEEEVDCDCCRCCSCHARLGHG